MTARQPGKVRIPFPLGSLARFEVCEPLQPSAEVQDMLLAVYKKNDFAAQVCERLVDLDEGLQEWRYRDVKMVEPVPPG